jgi:hypothetical protein
VAAVFGHGDGDLQLGGIQTDKHFALLLHGSSPVREARRRPVRVFGRLGLDALISRLRRGRGAGLREALLDRASAAGEGETLYAKGLPADPYTCVGRVAAGGLNPAAGTRGTQRARPLSFHACPHHEPYEAVRRDTVGPYSAAQVRRCHRALVLALSLRLRWRQFRNARAIFDKRVIMPGSNSMGSLAGREFETKAKIVSMSSS